MKLLRVNRLDFFDVGFCSGTDPAILNNLLQSIYHTQRVSRGVRLRSHRADMP
jgi:hypothetical protein